MIIHADMDAFYASVEIREQPALATRPVVVAGAADSRGVVSAANYVARQFGIHSAMPTRSALQRCPQLVVLPGRIGLYAEVSRQIQEIFLRYTPVIEPLSLDEAFLDVSKSEKLFHSAENIGRSIKHDVHEELDLVVSVGIASNKFIAKIASDLDKPDGYVYVQPGHEQAFLDPLPITRIWGIGKRGAAKLASFGIESIKQLRELPEHFLQQQFGKHGVHMWMLANGIDERPVVTEHEAKSISHERTFARDIQDPQILSSELSDLTEQVAWRLRHNDLNAGSVQLKLRFADFSTITRAHSLSTASNNTGLLWREVKALFEKETTRLKAGVRLIGMGAGKLQGEQTESAEQADLFQVNKKATNELDQLSDQIKQKFGKQAASRASSLKKRSR